MRSGFLIRRVDPAKLLSPAQQPTDQRQQQRVRDDPKRDLQQLTGKAWNKETPAEHVGTVSGAGCLIGTEGEQELAIK